LYDCKPLIEKQQRQQHPVNNPVFVMIRMKEKTKHVLHLIPAGHGFEGRRRGMHVAWMSGRREHHRATGYDASNAWSG
jgi:hypothetical protein